MRGMAQNSLNLIAQAKTLLEQIKPATVRGVAYQFFIRKLIKSMARNEVAKVSRLLVIARERGMIPWSYIVDETRETERVSAWDNLADYGEAILRSYRKNYWQMQPEQIKVWSEKATVRGLLAPILNKYAIDFQVMHGFSSATKAHEIADETGDLQRPLRGLYVGDWDPSGLYMSEVDLPERIDRYGGNVLIKRVALVESDITARGRLALPSFSVEEKRKDPRYSWFKKNYGIWCWELDAMNPNTLRDRVENAIRELMDMEAWEHCAKIEEAERESLKRFKWG